MQRRTLIILALATMLGGLGVGATLSVGALLLAEVSGNDAVSGLASATFNLGAALAGVPLAKLAAVHGRRRAIVVGNAAAMGGAILAVVGAGIGQWLVIALGITILGVASAVQLLSRFAATDLASPSQRARDLSLVVWSISIGAIVGPNLIGPGSSLGEWVGLEPLAGVFVFAFFAQLAAATVVWVGLRPDPLLTARAMPEPTTVASDATSRGERQTRTLGRSAQAAVVALIAMAQAIMVVLMAMTPLQLKYTGGANELIGLTLSIHIAGMYLFAPVFGLMASRFGRLPVIHLGWVTLAASAAMGYLWPDSHLLLVIALALLGLGWSAVTVAGATLITEITPADERTKRQGISDTVMSGSGALAGAVSGVLFAVGGFSFIAVVSLAMVATGVILALIVGWHRRRAIRANQDYTGHQ